MKTLLFSLILGLSSMTFSQDVLLPVKGQRACWLGVDFSIGKFVGSIGFTDPPQIKDHYMPTWNSLLISEKRINILDKGLKFESLSFNTDNVRLNNEEIEMDGYIQEKTHDISKSDVKELIAGYDYSEIEQQLCISIVVESFDKLSGFGEVWMVFNFRDKNSVFLKKFVIEPSGFGFRNYWLNVLKEAIVLTDNRHGKWLKGKG